MNEWFSLLYSHAVCLFWGVFLLYFLPKDTFEQKCWLYKEKQDQCAFPKEVCWYLVSHAVPAETEAKDPSHPRYFSLLFMAWRKKNKLSLHETGVGTFSSLEVVFPYVPTLFWVDSWGPDTKAWGPVFGLRSPTPVIKGSLPTSWILGSLFAPGN